MEMKILANDGIDATGKKLLEEMGCVVLTDKVKQDELAQYINDQAISGLLVRSATTARKELIDACPNLKFIGRGGVGIDNIDKVYAESKGVKVFNTPGAGSQSVAELVMSLMFASARYTFKAGGEMPATGASNFDSLKKNYSKGIELRGKTLGIVGFGKIGRSLASYALGCGMRVITFDVFKPESTVVSVSVGPDASHPYEVPFVEFDTLLSSSDFISLHVPKQANGNAVIGDEQFALLKKGVVLINTARGGVINEQGLKAQLDAGKVRFAALDVFENEPTPDASLLSHPQIISTPHIGASTAEAQERIGIEIAQRVKEIISA
jgi:D-3-phosphoglycerate dehydrogenase